MGRILTLTYQASDTIQVTLTSIYPARAIALLEKGDYRISASLGATLAGLRSIRMENAESIRLHAQGEEALYVMITPAAGGKLPPQHRGADDPDGRGIILFPDSSAPSFEK